MQNELSVEINVLLSSLWLGIICGIIFDFFKLIRYGKYVKTMLLVIQDILYYTIISVIIFRTILSVNGAQIRWYMPIAALCAFSVYRFLFSSYILRILLWSKKILKLIVKILLLPVMFLYKIIIFPFFKIKQKLLSKKSKIALTIKEFCFKIKCKFGKFYVCKNFCKERKPCRRKQKPEKRV